MDHKYNPMVKTRFHDGAGIFALIAISQIKKGDFWKTNDYLFNYDMSNNAIYLTKIAKDLNIGLKDLQAGINKR